MMLISGEEDHQGYDLTKMPAAINETMGRPIDAPYHDEALRRRSECLYST